MNIFEQVTTYPTNQRYINTFKPAATVKFVELGEPEPFGFSELQEYGAELKYRVMFRCNHVQLDAAKDNAIKQLVHGLYGDILPLVHELRNACMSGSVEEALAVSDKIETVCTGSWYDKARN